MQIGNRSGKHSTGPLEVIKEKATRRIPKGPGDKKAWAIEERVHSDDLLEAILTNVSKTHRSFVKNVKSFSNVKSNEEKKMRKDFSTYVVGDLDEFIREQIARVQQENAQTDTEEEKLHNKRNGFGPPSKQKRPHKRPIEVDDASLASYDTADDLRINDPEDYRAERADVHETLGKVLGNSPRGMTYMEAVLSPKRTDLLQEMLEKPLWTDAHEDAYQAFRRNRHDARGKHTFASTSHGLMSSFLCMHEFRVAHLEAFHKVKQESIRKQREREELLQRKMEQAANQNRRKTFWTSGPNNSSSAAQQQKSESSTSATTPKGKSKEKLGDVANWKLYANMLENHNKHSYEKPADIQRMRMDALEAIFNPIEELIARNEMAAFIVKSRESYIQGFLSKRQAYLRQRITSKREHVEKRKAVLDEKAKIRQARKQVQVEVERTRRRLKAIERKPKDIVKKRPPREAAQHVPLAEKRKGYMEKSSSPTEAPRFVLRSPTRVSCFFRAGAKGKAKDDKFEPKPLDLKRMESQTKRYREEVMVNGGGTQIPLRPSELFKLQTDASKKIQAIFRGRLSRRYLAALRWVEDDFHLNLVLKRFECRAGKLEFEVIPQLLEDLGRVRPECGVLEKIHHDLSPSFDDCIDTATFKRYFLKSRPRNPTHVVMIRLIHSVKGLKVKEDLLLNQRTSVLVHKFHRIRRRSSLAGTKEVETGAMDNKDGMDVEDDRDHVEDLREKEEPVKLLSMQKRENGAQFTSMRKRLLEANDSGFACGGIRRAASRADLGILQQQPLYTRTESTKNSATSHNPLISFVEPQHQSGDQDSEKSHKEKIVSDSHSTSKRVQEQPPVQIPRQEAPKSGMMKRDKPKLDPLPATTTMPRAASANLATEQRKNCTRQTEHGKEKEKGKEGPSQYMKKYKERIEANRLLSDRLRESREGLQNAARTMQKEKELAHQRVKSVLTGSASQVDDFSTKSRFAKARPSSAPSYRRKQAVEEDCTIGLQDVFKEYQYEKYRIRKKEELASVGITQDLDEYLMSPEEFEQSVLASQRRRSTVRNDTIGQNKNRLKNLKHVMTDLRVLSHSRTMPMPDPGDAKVKSAQRQNEAIKQFLSDKAGKTLDRIRSNPLLHDDA